VFPEVFIEKHTNFFGTLQYLVAKGETKHKKISRRKYGRRKE